MNSLTHAQHHRGTHGHVRQLPPPSPPRDPRDRTAHEHAVRNDRGCADRTRGRRTRSSTVSTHPIQPRIPHAPTRTFPGATIAPGDSTDTTTTTADPHSKTRHGTHYSSICFASRRQRQAVSRHSDVKQRAARLDFPRILFPPNRTSKFVSLVASLCESFFPSRLS